VPQNADPIAKPHSAVPETQLRCRGLVIQIGRIKSREGDREARIRPGAALPNVQAMKRSNPSTVVGGGEMNRDTSSVVSSAQSDVASDARSSRNTTCVPRSVGRPCRQSLLTIGATAGRTGLTATEAVPA